MIPPAPTWTEHLDLVQPILIGAVGLISWFTARTLKLIDRNQQELFSRLSHLEREFYQLKGAHRANHP